MRLAESPPENVWREERKSRSRKYGEHQCTEGLAKEERRARNPESK